MFVPAAASVGHCKFYSVKVNVSAHLFLSLINPAGIRCFTALRTDMIYLKYQFPENFSKFQFWKIKPRSKKTGL
jgi:hypothetical protein